jgi:hypothetical protein
VPPEARPGAFAGAAGLLHLRVRGRELPINFVRPREPRPPRDPNRRVLILAGALAGALVVGGAALAYTRVGAKNREVARLVAERTDLDQQLLVLDQEKKRGEALDAWLGGEVVYLDELYDLTAAAPEVNRLRVTQISGNPVAAAAGRKAPAARVELKGLVGEDTRPLIGLMNELAADGYHRVDAKKVEGNATGTSRRQFPQQWSTRYDLEKRPPQKYDRHFKADPPPRRRDRAPGGGFGDFGPGGAP